MEYPDGAPNASGTVAPARLNSAKRLRPGQGRGRNPSAESQPRGRPGHIRNGLADGQVAVPNHPSPSAFRKAKMPGDHSVRSPVELVRDAAGQGSAEPTQSSGRNLERG